MAGNKLDATITGTNPRDAVQLRVNESIALKSTTEIRAG